MSSDYEHELIDLLQWMRDIGTPEQNDDTRIAPDPTPQMVVVISRQGTADKPSRIMQPLSSRRRKTVRRVSPRILAPAQAQPQA